MVLFTCAFSLKCYCRGSFCWHWGFLSSVQVTLCRNSSCCLGVSSSSRGLWPSAHWPTSSQRYTNKHTHSITPIYRCLKSLISHPVGTCWGVCVCSDRQHSVHSARCRPALPSPLCVGQQCGGSDVCSCARSLSTSCVCRRWSKTTWCNTLKHDVK